MSRVSLFNNPLLLGFEHFEQLVDRAQKTAAEGYPPYNIEQLSEDCLRITIAVAGFSRNDLAATVEDNQLVIRGKREDRDSDRVFLHRGIATRQFQRSFVLAEGIEVISADLSDGLLHIDLERPKLSARVRKVEIGTGSRSGNGRAKRTGAIDVSTE